MRSLRNHFGFILPLIALLFAIEFSLMSERIVKEYENLMNNDYNIVIVANKELHANQISPLIATFGSLEILSSQKILDRLSNDISAKNLSVLQNALPKFYSLKLSSFPSPNEMNELKAKLQKLEGIARVETFSRTHNKVFKILKLAKGLSNMFMLIIAVIGTMLMLKQVRIWLYEHRERIETMTLFGAPFWLKSAMLYKGTFLDSLLSALFVLGVFYILPNLSFINALTSEIDLSLPSIDPAFDGAILAATALTLSVLVVSFVMNQVKKTSL